MCGAAFEKYDPKLPLRCATCAQLVNDWLDAPSWKDLLDYNREFILGKRRSTVYSIDPIFNEPELHQGLLRLHEYGFLVTDAQPGYDSSMNQDKQRNGSWYQVKERAYLRCVLPTNHPRISATRIEELLLDLISNPDIELVTYFEYAEYSKGTIHDNRYFAAPAMPADMPLTSVPKYKFLFTSVGSSNAGRSVAKHRFADTKEELEWTQWKKCKGRILPVLTERDLPKSSTGKRAFGMECTMTIGMRPVIITIAARKWPPRATYLSAIMENACVRSGMEPLFTAGAKKPENGHDAEGVPTATGTEVAEEEDVTPDLPRKLGCLSLKDT